MWENSTYKVYVRVESRSQKSSKHATCKGYGSIFFCWIKFILLNIKYLQSYYSFHVLENQVEFGKFLPVGNEGVIRHITN